MSTVVLLTSSPPPIFARSPTPADLSPALPSPDIILEGNSPVRRQFKHISYPRSTHSSFCGAEHVLAENITVKNKSMKSTTTEGSWIARPTSRFDEKVEEIEECGIEEPPSHGEGWMSTRSILGERAVTRRTDWTPPKPGIAQCGGSSESPEAKGFPTGLLGTFHFQRPSPVKMRPANDTVPPPPTKRKRLEFLKVQSGPLNEQPTLCPPQLPSGVTKKNKSPPKKPLTITALATSEFRVKEVGDDATDRPLMDYLEVSKESQMEEDIRAVMFGGKVAKTKAAIKKLKDSRKGKPKTQLVSPQTALKALEGQETIFGSASQLAMDESPTVLRDTIEALNRSTENFMSSPRSSPRATELTGDACPSVYHPSKPKKSKNLWAAAGRDGDNALLHVDTIDLTDTPAVRAAFAGKDVMVQTTVLSGGYNPLHPIKHAVPLKNVAFIDIDDIVTPTRGFAGAQQQARAFQTAARQHTPRSPRTQASPGPTAVAIPAAEQPKPDTQPENLSKISDSQPRPNKPNYAGFSDHDLKKQVKAYGFKALRKREKMIELLEKCWRDKYGSDEVDNATRQDALGYGDFLSHLHDVSARPVPKTPKAKKPRAPRKSKTSTDPAVTKAKKTRKRTATLDSDTVAESEQASSKKKRKRKLDVDHGQLAPVNVEDPQWQHRTALEAFEDWALPDKAQNPEHTTRVTLPLLNTPPATLPVEATRPSSPGLEDTPLIQQREEPILLGDLLTPQPTQLTQSKQTTQPTPLPDIQDQITAAINHESYTSSLSGLGPSPNQASTAYGMPNSSRHQFRRNHNLNPTWHEKMLLYDPIILEDLAVWLNASGLGAIGEDREVSALDVRTWCESRGVCCLWRGGWRGNRAVVGD